MRGLVVRGELRLCLATLALVSALATGCVTATKAPTLSEPTSWSSKMSAGLKNSTGKLAAMVARKPQLGTDNGFSPNRKPRPRVYVAMAEMHEDLGNVAEAETQLRKALALDKNHLGALLAYARLEDRQRNFQSAEQYYQRALKKHSKNALVHNHMGLCYHRHGKLPEAASALSKAVELQPDEKLYRDNLAAALVDQGNIPQALAQLQMAHGQPVGHYNLAYLLVQKRDHAAALHHFQQATQLDPSFTEAQQWVAQLSAPAHQVGPTSPGQPAAMIARRGPIAPYAPGSIAPGGVAAQVPSTGGRYAGPQYPVQSGPPRTAQGTGNQRLPSSEQPLIR
jgi:Tfp pilus assembly protein PilF